MSDDSVVSSVLGRGFYLVAGMVSLGLGAAGVLLPLLPTTPFVLLAAACFARSSPRLYHWLLGSQVFGPLIVDWNQNRSIRRSAKVSATVMIGLFGSIAVWVAPLWWVKVGLVVWFLSILTWLWTRPESGGSKSEGGEPAAR